ncbi:MAG: hypothetical protein ACR2FH_00190 [Caulobacteraceae bacterium]
MRSTYPTDEEASKAYEWRHLAHRDPADRPPVATAIELAWPLVT